VQISLLLFLVFHSSLSLHLEKLVATAGKFPFVVNAEAGPICVKKTIKTIGHNQVFDITIYPLTQVEKDDDP